MNEPGSVMGGAVSWAALSETTRSVPRSSSDVPSPVSDGSVSPSQTPTSQPVNNNSGATNSTSNDTTLTRPRLRNRCGGSSSVSGALQNAFSQQHLMAPHNMVPPEFDACVRGLRPTGGVGGSQSHTGINHPQRNKSRWGAYGRHFQDDGGQREQDRGFISPPPLLAWRWAIMPHPQPFRMFPGQMGFSAASPFISFPTMPPGTFRTMQMVPPPHPFYTVNDTLTNMIIKQVDFNFSDDNLAKDNFLRSKIDGSGWVPGTLIVSFRRVSFQFPLEGILDTLCLCTI